MPNRAQKFRRLLLFFLATLTVCLVGLYLGLPLIIRGMFPALFYVPALGPTPGPPTITVPRGPLPSGVVGLKECVGAFASAELNCVGSGFVLRLPDSTAIGVTTAHSVGYLGTTAFYEYFVFFPAGDTQTVVFDHFYGPPGWPRAEVGMTRDYVLLKPTPRDEPLAQTWALAPDPRGRPQLGERVMLYSGLGDETGQPRLLSGTVIEVSPESVWVSMDEVFAPGGMSGSPFLSQHTGQVVGMAIAATEREGRVLIGFHPVDSLLAYAAAAQEFPLIEGYTR